MHTIANRCPATLTHINSILRSLPFVALFLVAFSCRVSQTEPRNVQAYLLGTIINIDLYDHADAALEERILASLQSIEDRMSLQKAGSQLNAISVAAGQKPIAVDADVFLVVQAALDTARWSNGAFDPTIAPVVQAWDIGGDRPRIPPAPELASLLPLLGWREVVLDPAARTVFLPRPGMQLDLGAIAKGWAADEIARLCREAGVQAAMLDLGGNILAIGAKPGRDVWRLGIQDPLADRGSPLGMIAASNATLVTSGPYERFIEVDGKRYHHILSPFDGFPADTGLLQVSIFSRQSSMIADSLSTACFVLGREKGMALLESLEGYEGVFVDTDRKVWTSSGLGKDFSLLSADYTLARP